MFAALVNSALVSLFPPYDYLSLQRGNVPTFAGFYWLFGEHGNHVINSNFQALEFFVVLANAAIAWLLLNNKVETPQKNQRWRNGVLWMVAINLVVILLFPPFENYTAITKAMLPSFEGFYFIFGDNSQRQIVTTILYIEIAFLLINGGLLLLFLKDRTKKKLSPQEIRALAQRLQKQR